VNIFTFQKYSTRFEKEEITNYVNCVLLDKEHTVKTIKTMMMMMISIMIMIVTHSC